MMHQRDVGRLVPKNMFKDALRNLQAWLETQDRVLKTRALGVLPSGYRPELDISPYCDEEHLNYYQQQIGVFKVDC